MKTPIGKTARAHRMLAGILATLLLALPATAADWKSMTPPPVPTGYAAVETINGIIYVAGGGITTAAAPMQRYKRSTQRLIPGHPWRTCPLPYMKGTELE